MVFSDYLSAAALGVSESMNPCMLATMLVFLLFMQTVVRRRRAVFFNGLFFIALFVFGFFCGTIGVFDGLYAAWWVSEAIRIAYWVLATFFIAVGFVYAIGWWRYYFRNTLAPAVVPPVFFLPESADERSSSRSFRQWVGDVVRIGTATVLIVGVVVIMGGVWPQGYGIYQLYGLIMMKEESPIAIILFVLYSVAFGFPLLITWLMTLSCAKRNTVSRWLEGRKSLLLIISAAVYFAVGGGLAYIFIQ